VSLTEEAGGYLMASLRSLRTIQILLAHSFPVFSVEGGIDLFFVNNLPDFILHFFCPFRCH
jgi:hypothetical protein